MLEDPVDENYRSCPSHCCKNHGCKYALKGCPVKNGTVEQEYPCEMCTWDLEDADRPYREGEIGTRVVVGFRREDKTMADLPSDQAVEDAIRAVLDGMEVAPGWRITFVGAK